MDGMNKGQDGNFFEGTENGCMHVICNEVHASPSDITMDELRFILSCLVERGLIEWYGVTSDGQNLYKRIEGNRKEGK